MNEPNRRLLDGQIALITGASSGIGAASAVALAEAGAKVGVNYRGGREGAEEIVQRIRDSGGNALAIEADVSNEESVGSMFSRLVGAFGRVDILVANAGLQRDAPAINMSLKEWQAVLEVNLTGQFLCTREAIKYFLRQGLAPASKSLGKVVCMSSVHEAIPWAGRVNYAASKGGILMMMKTLAQEVAEKKIRINGIAPGVIKTSINKESWSDPEKASKLVKLVPYGRLGEPEDVAKAVVWLVSDDSDYITGTTLFVDGGMALYPAFRESG
jgi:glucose 1-dehydrogenase